MLSDDLPWTTPMMDDEFSDMEEVPGDDMDDYYVDETTAQIQHSLLFLSTRVSPLDSCYSHYSVNSYYSHHSLALYVGSCSIEWCSVYLHSTSHSVTHAPRRLVLHSLCRTPITQSTRAPSTYASPLTPLTYSPSTRLTPSTHAPLTLTPPLSPLTTWSDTLAPVTIQPRVGPTLPVPESLIDIFNLFFTKNFLHGIVDEVCKTTRTVWQVDTDNPTRAKGIHGILYPHGNKQTLLFEDGIHPFTTQSRSRFRNIVRIFKLRQRRHTSIERLSETRLTWKSSSWHGPSISQGQWALQHSPWDCSGWGNDKILREIVLWNQSNRVSRCGCWLTVTLATSVCTLVGVTRLRKASVVEPSSPSQSHSVPPCLLWQLFHLWAALSRRNLCLWNDEDRRGFPTALKQVKFKQRYFYV